MEIPQYSMIYAFKTLQESHNHRPKFKKRPCFIRVQSSSTQVRLNKTIWFCSSSYLCLL